MSTEPKRMITMALDTPKVVPESFLQTFKEAWDTKHTSASPPVTSVATWRNTAGGFALTPYVGTPKQHIYKNYSPMAGMAISLDSPYFAITTSQCYTCKYSFYPANSSTYNPNGSQVTWNFWGFGIWSA